jgi:PAS domain S-box-containing protein
MNQIKIFYKFLIVILLLSAVPLLIVGYRLININRLGLQDVILELHTKQAVSISHSIEEYMRNLKERVKFVISSHGESTINWNLSQRILKSMIASSQEFFTVSTVNEEGKEIAKVYHPSLEGKVKLEYRATDPTFVQAKKTTRFSISSLYYVDNIPRLNVVYPFTENMYLYIEASLQRLLENVQDTTIGKTGFAYIVDREGKIIMHPNISKALRFESVADRPIVKEVLSRHLVGSKEYMTKQGKRVIGAYAPVAALNWGVIIQQDKEEAYLSVARMRKNAIILLVAVVIVASILGYILTHNLTNPILKLTTAARTIAQGSFNVVGVSQWLKKVKIRDEMSELARTFISMTGELKRYTDMQADKMNAILFSIADGIMMTDYSGKVILSNRRAKELLGMDPKEKLDNKNIQDIIDREEIALSLKEAQEKKENIIKELDLSLKNNPKFLRTDTSLVAHSESGAELGAVTVVRDITLEKELEQMKDDFIHSITHDLRSPMTSIRGFLEFLLDGSSGDINEQQKEFLDIIDKSSARLLDMINDILDVAKMESGRMPMNIENVSFEDIAQLVVKSLESQAKKDKVGLYLETKNEIESIDADKNLIHRVITNLVSNALKFTPEQGEVKIIIEDIGDKMQVSIQDTGEGMPAEYVDKIFDKFEQVKGSRGKRKGTGLGLTITKYIVETHGGKIWAESEIGKGSRFTFWIPKGAKSAT